VKPSHCWLMAMQRNSLVPKLQLGNAALEAPASRDTTSWSLPAMGSQAGAWEPAKFLFFYVAPLRRCVRPSFLPLSECGSVVRSFPSSSSHRYTQVPPTQKRRHSGMDCRNPVPWTVTCRLHKCLIQLSCQPLGSHPCDWIPAVHAGMTGFNHLCITTRVPAFSRSQAPAWECGFGSSSFPRHDKLELASNGFPSWSLGTSQVFILLRCAFASLRETSSSCSGDRMPAILRVFAKMRISVNLRVG